MSLSSATVIVRLHRCCLPPLTSAAAAIITTPLSLPSLTARSRPSPLQSAAQSGMLSSSATVAIRHRHCPPLPYLHLSSLLQDNDYCIVSRAGPPQQVICDGIYSLTTIGPYLAHRFFWASFKFNNFSNFCLLTTFDSSKWS